MKKYCITLLSLLFALAIFTNGIFAQGFYLEVNTGYGIAVSAQDFNFFSVYNYSFDTSKTSYEQINSSLGKGINAGINCGYMFSKNIGAELGVSYLLGDKITARHFFSDNSMDYSLSAKMLQIAPSLVVNAGGEEIDFYAKFGLLIGIGSVTLDRNDYHAGHTEVLKTIYDGGAAIGLKSAAGAAYRINETMAVTLELNLVNLSYSPKKGELTVATYDGADMLPNMTVSDKQSEFSDSYSYTAYTQPSSNEPKKELTQKIPFGSFGMNLGFRIGL